jgi:shikimate dehydrogenase
LGAVNTVVFDGEKRIGHNTDWLGFAESFHLGLADVAKDEVTQLGAGGAGSAVAYAMLQVGARVLNLFDTDSGKAQQLAVAMNNHFAEGRVQLLTSLADALDRSDGLINATPVGMKNHPGLPLPAMLLRPSLWVAEVVYFPLQTELLKTARTLGCRTLDGGGMAVFQAAEAFRLFTGRKADSQRMLEWFRANIRA